MEKDRLKSAAAIAGTVAILVATACAAFLKILHLSFGVGDVLTISGLALSVAASVFGTIQYSDDVKLEKQRVDNRLRTAEEALLATGFTKASWSISERKEFTEPNNSDIAEAAVNPAGLVARITLQKYWDSNLNQNRLIFRASVVASIVGFLVTLWGAGEAFSGKNISASAITITSGAITQIIGASFLAIYRATTNQALAFSLTLERIDATSIAWTILESMSNSTESERALKNQAKADLVKLILQRSKQPEG